MCITINRVPTLSGIREKVRNSTKVFQGREKVLKSIKGPGRVGKSVKTSVKTWIFSTFMPVVSFRGSPIEWLKWIEQKKTTGYQLTSDSVYASSLFALICVSVILFTGCHESLNVWDSRSASQICPRKCDLFADLFHRKLKKTEGNHC